MDGKLCPKLILEGTRLTMKTETAFALNEHPRIVGPKKYRYHSPLISAEWCSFTNYPWGRGPSNFIVEAFRKRDRERRARNRLGADNKKCHAAHFDAIGMGGILEKHIGSIDSFIDFLEKEWNWKVTDDKAKKTNMADENKETCICPLIKGKIITSGKMCSCSEGFAERMFSLVLQKKVRAEEVRSYIRNKKSRICKITIPG